MDETLSQRMEFRGYRRAGRKPVATVPERGIRCLETEYERTGKSVVRGEARSRLV